MRSDYEDVARNLLGESKKVDLKAVSKLMDSPEAKALLKQLSGPGGDGMKKAAEAAAEGDKNAAQKLFSSLMNSKEGQALTRQVMEATKKQ